MAVGWAIQEYNTCKKMHNNFSSLLPAALKKLNNISLKIPKEIHVTGMPGWLSPVKHMYSAQVMTPGFLDGVPKVVGESSPCSAGSLTLLLPATPPARAISLTSK